LLSRSNFRIRDKCLQTIFAGEQFEVFAPARAGFCQIRLGLPYDFVDKLRRLLEPRREKDVRGTNLDPELRQLPNVEIPEPLAELIERGEFPAPSLSGVAPGLRQAPA